MKSPKYILVALLSLALFSCKKEDNWKNPFDDPSLQPPPDTTNEVLLNPASIEGLHKNIFSPTCANSGCHDGTFEPDFRTIESTYHTLVYHGLVKNDPLGSYRYRVYPGMADSSLIIARMTYDIDGQSGTMPLYPSQIWEDNKATHILNIRNWINAGAKDMFGNTPVIGNMQPMEAGIIGKVGASTLSRRPGKGPLKVNPGTNAMDIYFSLSDAETAPQDLSYRKVRFSTSLNDFSNATELDLVDATPFTGYGFLGDTVVYQHKVTVNPSNWAAGTIVFFRVYVQDAGPVVTEIPNYGSENYIKTYSAFVAE